MKRAILTGSAAACIWFGLAAPLVAAQPSVSGTVNDPSAQGASISAIKPAEKCLSDLRALNGRMDKDGYWMGGSAYGYGYPMDGLGFGVGQPMAGLLPETTTGYRNVRPGYEVRILAASANILARHGYQQSCEKVLAVTRNIYKLYVADMRNGRVPMANGPAWRNQLLATAQPVTSSNASFRSDELIDTDVRSPQNEPLGSVDDLVMSPQTGKIAYLVVARGGIFGIDEKYVAVPWGDFKIIPNVDMLVLDTTSAALDAAPTVSHDEFATPGQFGQQSQKVDAYWKAHLSNEGGSGPNG